MILLGIVVIVLAIVVPFIAIVVVPLRGYFVFRRGPHVARFVLIAALGFWLHYLLRIIQFGYVSGIEGGRGPPTVYPDEWFTLLILWGFAEAISYSYRERPRKPQRSAASICPNCDSKISRTMDECPKCHALLGPGTAWFETADKS